MEFSTFCFCNGKKFWHQLKCILKSMIQAEHWLKSVIQKTFVNPSGVGNHIPQNHSRKIRNPLSQAARKKQL